MRILVIAALAAALAACATTSATTPAATVAASSAPVPQASRLAQLLAAAGRPNAPAQSEIERLLGPPDIARHDGAGAALTYRLESCALLLLFSADAANTMRLAEANPSARHAGATPPTLEQCATEAGARHS